MAATPIKGQEVLLLLLAGTEVQQQFTHITDFSLTFQIELIEENYVGMTSAEFDEVFKGVHGDMTLQMWNKEVFTFVERVLSKAQRRTPGETFSFKAKFKFPGGGEVRLLLPDIHFGEIPFSGNRTQHSTMKVSFACSGARLIG